MYNRNYSSSSPYSDGGNYRSPAYNPDYESVKESSWQSDSSGRGGRPRRGASYNNKFSNSRRDAPYNKNNRGSYSGQYGDRSNNRNDNRFGSDSGTNFNSRPRRNDSNSQVDEAYYGVPQIMLCCHLCTKIIKDPVRFSDHLQESAHQKMVKDIGTGHDMFIAMKRQEIKVEQQMNQFKQEQENVINKNESKRFCSVCDLEVIGDFILHGQHNIHQLLDAFMHPDCKYCEMKFSSRIEWESHKLSAPHLQQQAAKVKKVKQPIVDIRGESDDVIEFPVPTSEEEEWLLDEPESENTECKVLKFKDNTLTGQSVVREKLFCMCCNIAVDNLGDHCKTKDHFESYKNYLKDLYENVQDWGREFGVVEYGEDEVKVVADEVKPVPDEEEEIWDC